MKSVNESFVRIIADLRSDTLTNPDLPMREVMACAPVGDDCYGEDPSVRALELRVAEMLGKEAALFMPSGTMSNQVALRVHTQPGDEVITETGYHISYFESAQCADLARVVLHTATTADGILRVEDVERLIDAKPRGANYAQASLVTIENTVAAHGGVVFPLHEAQALAAFARSQSLAIHLDGARLFNASVASGVSAAQFAACADSVSVCFAKGLGAPFGSALCGTQAFINEAKRYRKWYGGALHQSGMLAAAALFALDTNIERLEVDHDNAQFLAGLLSTLPKISVSNPNPETNFVFFDVSATGLSPREFSDMAAKRGVLLFPWTKGQVRAMTHAGVSPEQLVSACRMLGEMVREVRAAQAPLEPADVADDTGWN